MSRYKGRVMPTEPVSAYDALLALVHETATNRATCGTSMNRTSSRSHAILLMRVEQWMADPTPAAEDPPDAAAADGADGGPERTLVPPSLLPPPNHRRTPQKCGRRLPLSPPLGDPQI